MDDFEANVENFFEGLEHKLDGIEQNVEGFAKRLEAWCEDLESRHPYATTVIGLPLGLLLFIPFFRKFAERQRRAPESPPTTESKILTPSTSEESLEQYDEKKIDDVDLEK